MSSTDPELSPLDRFKRSYSRSSQKKPIVSVSKDDSDESIDEITIPTVKPVQTTPRPAQANAKKISLYNALFCSPKSPKVANRESKSIEVSKSQVSPTDDNRPNQVDEPRLDHKNYSRLIHIDDQSSGLLEGERMLNDTVVDIYLAYLLDNLPESLRRTIHLFSTFFYCKFRSISQSSLKDENLQREVKRWEKDVKLFDKHYLVYPICVGHHWILVIVNLHSKIQRESIFSDVPPMYRRGCMMIFDSLRFIPSSYLTKPIREFLVYRWRFERPGGNIINYRDPQDFREISANVPRQRNTHDCGIYLLNSFSKFFADPEKNSKRIWARFELSEWSFDAAKRRKDISTEIRAAKSKGQSTMIS